MDKKRYRWGKFVVFIMIFLLLCLQDNTSSIVKDSDTKGWLVQYAGDSMQTVYHNDFVLEQGKYELSLKYYVTNEGSSIRIFCNGKQKENLLLPVSKEEQIISFELEEAVPDVEVEIVYGGEGYIEIQELSMQIKEGTWNKDAWLKSGVAGFLLICSLLVYSCYKKGKLSYIQIEDAFLVIVISLLASSVLLSDNKVGNGDDLKYHLMRIEGIAAGLRNGQFPVMVYPNMVKENGYLNAMYPSVFLYIPAVLRNMGVSYVVAYKILLIFVNLGTSVSMYISAKSVVKERKLIFFAIIMYEFFRYRLNNLYVRGALGEALAMMFLPMILVGIYHVVCGKREKWYLLVIGGCGVFQSHILSIVLYAVLCGIIVIVFLPKVIAEKRYIELIKVIVVILLLNIWFIFPFIFYYAKGNLALDELAVFYYWKEALNPSYLFGIFQTIQTEQGYGRDYALRIPFIVLFIFNIRCYLLEKENRKKDFWNIIFSIGIFLLFMATNCFPYDKMRDSKILHGFFSLVQFPWRFVGIAGGIIVLVSIVYINRLKCTQTIKMIGIGVLSITILFDTSMWNLQWNESMNGYIESSEMQKETNPTEEKVCADIIMYAREYFVKGNGEQLETYRVSNDTIQIVNYQKDGLNVCFDYNASEQGTIDLPLMNYQLFDVRDEKGNKLTYKTGEYGNIAIEVEGDEQKHSVSVSYQEPIIFRVCEFISVGVLLLLTLHCIRKCIERKNNGRKRYEQISV